MYTRETRQGSELVHDNVEDCLVREVRSNPELTQGQGHQILTQFPSLVFQIETLRRHQDKLMDEMDKLNAQLSRLRAARHELEIDIRNKEQALSTDEGVRQLTESSTDIGGIHDIGTGYR